MRIRVLETSGLFLLAALCLGSAGESVRAQNLQEPLAQNFGDVFSNEFGNSSQARAIWEVYGGAVLADVENQIYPPIAYELFREQALARIRQARKAKPELSPALLSFVAQDGLAPSSPLPPRNIALAIVHDENAEDALTSITGDDIARVETRVEQNVLYHAFTDEFKIPVLEIPVLIRGSLTNSLYEAIAFHKGPIVVDLRGNMGGVLTEVPVVAALFQVPDQLVFVMESKGGAWEAFRTPMEPIFVDASRILV